MKEKEMKEKLKKINKEFDEVNKHLKEATETTVLECMYAKDDVDKKIDETKKNIEAAKENIKRKQQETHEKFSSHITKIQKLKTFQNKSESDDSFLFLIILPE